MKIDSSYIGMESARSQASVTAAKINVATQGSVKLQQGYYAKLLTGWTDRDKLTQTNGDMMSGLRYMRSGTYSVKGIANEGQAEMLHRLREKCVMYLFEMIFGNRKKGGMTADGYAYGAQKSVTEAGRSSTGNHEWEERLIGGSGSVLETYLSPASGQQISADLQYFHAEKEVTSFQTTGKVVTKDGREIDFGLELTMSRSFARYYQEHYETPQTNLCDPLVINLDTEAASLSDQKFMFDLDQDGILDRISVLEKGSGYLAFDKNGDGKINDGGELFGTSTGDGFSELAAYDDDKDGWIDEDDEIFDKLLIWTKDENGNDVLYHLKEAGVGAICLSSVSTEFSLNSLETNETNGVIRSTGVFLYENGGVGTVQHIDVAK